MTNEALDDHGSIASDDELQDDVTTEQLDSISAQQKGFGQWMLEQARNGGFNNSNDAGTADTLDDSLMTVKGLVAKQESEKIIDSARSYQTELFERAKKENLIAVLDTGSGKTLIAVLLTRWILDQEAEYRAAGRSSRVTFFLVPSVNLVIQQTCVLQTNIGEQHVTSLYGALNIDIWSKDDWNGILTRYRVIVCTPDILRRALDKQFVSIQGINLLIFDEAHHTKQNHAYARIVKDHYLQLQPGIPKPRIFGMTASPIDAKSDVNLAAKSLESLLDSHIVTTGDLSSLASMHRPNEVDVQYDNVYSIWNTNLAREIFARSTRLPIIREEYDKATIVANQLGTWCADHSILYFLTQNAQEQVKRRIEGRNGRRLIEEPEEVEKDKAVYDDFFEYMKKAHGEKAAPPKSEGWSNKVAVLKRIFEDEIKDGSDDRCLVFVTQKSTARLLSILFGAMNLKHIRCGYLVGANAGAFEDQVQTFKQQVLTLSKFRKGELNVLFATSVAEEGLDIPLCNLVIRFDLYKTMIQYIQSRGRARHKQSKFVHMIDRSDPQQHNLRHQVMEQEQKMRDWCAKLPEDRQLLGEDPTIEQLTLRDRGKRSYTNATSGARLSYDNALECLQQFVANWPLDSEEPKYATYVPLFLEKTFKYEVLLPQGAPIHHFVGKECTRKLVAKQSAAFSMCIELFKQGHLDDHFLPVRVREVHAMRNAILAVENKATTEYPMRTKPAIWTETRGLQTSKLWMTLVTFSTGLDYGCRALIMLTRSQMPRFPAFPIYRHDGKESKVYAMSGIGAIEVDEHETSTLAAFTFRIFKDVFSKVYQNQPEQLPYFLVPGKETMTDVNKTSIDWDLIRTVTRDSEDDRWTSDTDNSSMCGRVLVDRFDGARKFLIKDICQDKKPQDPVTGIASKYRYHKNILDYSFSASKKFRDQYSWSPGQPVFEAELLALRRNMLKPAGVGEAGPSQVLICAEPLMISRLPMSVFTSCLVWPSIIWRFESVLIALETCKYVGLSCQSNLALAAITKDTESATVNDTTYLLHTDMGENYERLEFLGDCFLKLATTLAVFVGNPHANEDNSHVERMLMLCNKNLLDVSNKLRLHEYIRSKGMSRRLWYPEGLQLLEGKGAGQGKESEYHNQKHKLSDKTVADVSEALIGAAWLSHNKPGQWQASQWKNAVKAVTKLVGAELHQMRSWQDYIDAYTPPEYQTRASTAAQRELVRELDKHGYHFNSPTLARSAFLHASNPYSWENLPSYERLEFLGDALLDMVVISHIFYTYPDKDPQWLTEAKMMMVGNDFYGFLACKLGFHEHIRHSTSSLGGQIHAYVTEYQEKQELLQARDGWLQLSSAPKCLADLVEAYIGAMFIDSGFDYSKVQNFFDQNIKPHFEDMSVYAGKVKGHPVTQLHHVLQIEMKCRQFKFYSAKPPADMHSARKNIVVALMIHDTVVSHSIGVSIRYPSDRAANEGLRKLRGLTREEFKEKYSCNCVGKRDATAMQE